MNDSFVVPIQEPENDRTNRRQWLFLLLLTFIAGFNVVPQWVQPIESWLAARSHRNVKLMSGSGTGSSKSSTPAPCSCESIPETITCNFQISGDGPGCSRSGTATVTYDPLLGFWRGGGDDVSIDIACLSDELYIVIDCDTFSGGFGEGTSGPVGGPAVSCEGIPFSASFSLIGPPGLLESCGCQSDVSVSVQCS